MKDIAVNKIHDLFDDLKRDKKALVKMLAIIVILLLAVVLRIHGAGGADVTVEAAETAANAETELAADEDAGTYNADICVDIGGEVANPGVYKVSEGTRLYQLIELAGGLTALADTDAINRASFVEDGEKIIIPAKNADGFTSSGEAAASADVQTSAGISPEGLVNINLASRDELKTLNGIGDVTADKIIEYRKSNRFKKKEDIKSVNGIGEGIYEKIKDDITC